MTAEAYPIALGAYLGSALLALVLFGWWLRGCWGPGRRCLLLLCGAALLLTPAFPHGGVDTLAPALVVAAFQFFTSGELASATHALRPLAAALLAAVIITALLRLTLWRTRAETPRS
ncbi:hypothetical protein [Haliea atlantica]|jgi:hypothetical protein|nr:hypothetical protein [Haliea sp.]MAL94083.1 hypothetical protein [Haliea sp.]|tara:strand:- start:148798 stop:149148 length:351 start_codon:yes stop_codon:yes gene_type:complete